MGRVKPARLDGVQIFCVFLFFAALLFHPAHSAAETNLSLSFHMGSLDPDKSATPGTFDKDFFFDGSFGVENSAGFEFRARVGHYSEDSNNPDDIGTGLSLDITPLTASLFYHIWEKSGMDFFAGVGIGAYFYDVTNSASGTLEEGTSFGKSLAFGIKYNFTKTFFVSTLYEKHFVERIFFPNSSNFNNTIFTVGIGFSLPTSRLFGNDPSDEQFTSGVRGVKKQPYRYSASQESLLVEMFQMEHEISEIEQRLGDLSREVSARETEVGDNDADRKKIEELLREIKGLRKNMSDATLYLENLERRRYDLGISSLPLSYHFDYLFSNYWISPYGLQYTDGFLFYGRHPFRGRFYNYWHPKRGSSATENSDEFLKKKKDEIKRLKKRRF